MRYIQDVYYHLGNESILLNGHELTSYKGQEVIKNIKIVDYLTIKYCPERLIPIIYDKKGNKYECINLDNITLDKMIRHHKLRNLIKLI